MSKSDSSRLVRIAAVLGAGWDFSTDAAALSTPARKIPEGASRPDPRGAAGPLGPGVPRKSREIYQNPAPASTAFIKLF